MSSRCDTYDSSCSSQVVPASSYGTHCTNSALLWCPAASCSAQRQQHGTAHSTVDTVKTCKIPFTKLACDCLQNAWKQLEHTEIISPITHLYAGVVGGVEVPLNGGELWQTTRLHIHAKHTHVHVTVHSAGEAGCDKRGL
jgi:hypothetical protein